MGSRRNTKKLSLILPCSPHPAPVALLRRDEDGSSPSLPYTDGPVQVIPGLWIGSEDNARDWVGLRRRRIGAILNVAKEVSSPFDPLRSTASVPNLNSPFQPTYYPPHIPTGRPPMHYLNLQWSHGQKDLVNDGFQAGMAFADAAFARGDGVLVHCQCGISRSATMVIALVMRAAAHRSPSVPPEVWALEGMQGAYSYVKAKSKWIGPNMSLIYELLDYEKVLKSSSCSLTSGQEGEWSRKRQLLDHIPPEQDTIIMQEARALDKAMEDRVVARKSSASSLASTTSMGFPWQNRFHPRKRAGSIASNMTSNSIVSEHLVEEDEEPELLGIGGGFDSERERRQSADTLESSATNSPDDDIEATPRSIAHASTSRPFSHLHISPSAPAWKNSFDIIPPPRTAARSTFDLPPRLKSKYRPSPIRLSPVPPPPVAAVVTAQEVNSPPVPASTDQTGLLHSPSQSLPTTTQTSSATIFNVFA
ncbi:tyrosine/serine/threonine protein phosphatase [Leucoagaricus gongylophorus]